MPSYSYACSCGNSLRQTHERGCWPSTVPCTCGGQAIRTVNACRGTVVKKFKETPPPTQNRRVWGSGDVTYQFQDEDGGPYRFKSGTKAGQKEELKQLVRGKMKEQFPESWESIEPDIQET